MPCFDIWTSWPWEISFWPQRRAISRHPNFQKWSGAGLFCTFWFGNVLGATAACHFWTSWSEPVMFSKWNVFHGASACKFSFPIWPDGSAPPALARLLLDPPGPQIILENTAFRNFPTISRACISFLLTFSFSLLFSSLLLSLHIVGGLISKLRLITSSTAQGGGGSFKNRKPIGEIGCCESQMPEQKQSLIELSNYLAD